MSDVIDKIVGGETSRYNKRIAYREYYDGEHDTQLSDRQREYLQLKVGEEFNDNYCPVVVDALAERLNVIGIKAENQSETMWDWWQINRMDATQKTTHTGAVRDGDDYILVSWDNDKDIPTFSYEPAYDGSEGVEVVYGFEHRNTPIYAFKRWPIEKGERLNIYYPDEIKKYTRQNEGDKGNDWAEFKDEGDTEWPVPWKNDAGEPLGIPVIHFKNGDRGYNYGQSELKNIVPLQNALNKSIIDLVAAADTTAFRVYWMIGDDPSGIKVVPGSWIYSTKPPSEASIGHISGEDLSKMIEFKDTFVTEIARVSRTPLSYFQMSGQVAAEGTMKQQESGLVARAKDRQVVFGNAWEDAFYLARRLWNVYANAESLDEEEMIEVLWKDPETRNDKNFLETLKTKMALRIPVEVLWGEMGYNSQEIDEMKKTPEFMSYMSMLGMDLSIDESENG